MAFSHMPPKIDDGLTTAAILSEQKCFWAMLAGKPLPLRGAGGS